MIRDLRGNEDTQEKRFEQGEPSRRNLDGRDVGIIEEYLVQS